MLAGYQFLGVEGGQTIILLGELGVTDIEPFVPSPLDKLREREVEILDIGADGYPTPSQFIYPLGARLPLQGREFTEDAEVRLDTEPTLTQHDEARNVQNRIG